MRKFECTLPGHFSHWLLGGCASIVEAMSPQTLYPRDQVRVINLEAEDREVDSSVDPPPRPRVGEIGVIVDEVAEGIYLVERCTDDGRLLWVAEFLGSELEKIE